MGGGGELVVADWWLDWGARGLGARALEMCYKFVSQLCVLSTIFVSLYEYCVPLTMCLKNKQTYFHNIYDIEQFI